MGEGVVVAGDVESKSRKGLLHYTRIVLDPLSLKVVKATCSCEAGSFGKKCWHLKTLEQMIKEELRERIEKARQEMMQIEEDIASWG
ncbi:SWIM zinc finger-containing protein [Metallosphaera yellowstonensis MK1]|uniref:SWIM zinc finger-containing protein n=1 Tax=Metallosphaera yellowstonensis MK1 TaxID=671065 RepID=H2C2I7_9CREN|nr:SWIM zinc finger-containing protein [Metallosphaera yellowstonensis MK1]